MLLKLFKVTFVCVFFVGLEATWAFTNPITLYITDFGINQWNSSLQLGDDLQHAENRVFPDLPSLAQIVVPMPPDTQWNELSQMELTQHFAEAIQAKVEAGLAQGIETFEIQLVQNINTKGYLDQGRQDMVNQFGGAAYKAIGVVLNQIEQQGKSVGTYAIVGSNGTKVLTENVASWQRGGTAYLYGIDFFDGRAFMKPTVATIQAVGAGKVRFFNTKGDYPAPYTPLGFRSIGSYDTVRNIKDRYPEVTSYILSPTNTNRSFGYGHIAGMRDPKGEFHVREYRGRQGTHDFLESVQGHDLRPLTWGLDRQRTSLSSENFKRTNPDSHTERLESRIQVSRIAAENLSAGVFAYANALKDIHEQALKQLPFLRNNHLNASERNFFKTGQAIKQTYDLALAIEQDLKDRTEEQWAFLRLQTLEATGKFGLDLIGSLKLETHPMLSKWTVDQVARVGAYQDIVTGVAKHIGRGKADLDVVEHYMNGVKELAKGSLEAKGKLTPKFHFLDGLQGLAMAGAHHVQNRRLDIETVTKYLDAVTNLAWTGLGVVACGGSVGCTTAIQKIGTTSAKVGRESTQGVFNKVILFFRRQKDEVIEQWLSTQKRNIQLGLPIQKISQVYGFELLQKNGLNHKRIAELDKAADQALRELPNIPVSIPSTEIGAVIDMARLSGAVYKKEFVPFQGNNGGQWQQIHHEKMRSGLEWSLYELRRTDGKVDRVMAFAGTNPFSPKDWGTNLLQASIPPAQYQEALAIATTVANKSHREKNVSLTITGHSLGGSIAQYVAVHTGSRAIVFNSAPLGLRSYPLDAQTLQAASSKIINVYMKGEPVRNAPGLQLGRTYELNPVGLLSQIDPKKSSGFTLRETIALHDQKLMISSLEMMQMASSRQGAKPLAQTGQERNVGGVELDGSKQAVVPEDLSPMKQRIQDAKGASPDALFHDF